MRGETIPPAPRWAGNPIAPWPCGRVARDVGRPRGGRRRPVRARPRQRRLRRRSTTTSSWTTGSRRNRLRGSGAARRLRPDRTLPPARASTWPGCGSTQGDRRRRRRRRGSASAAASCTSRSAAPLRPARARPWRSPTAARPRPLRRSAGARSGWEELDRRRDRRRPARRARRPGSRATTCPATRRRYRIAVTTESPYTVVANGVLVERGAAGQPHHVGVRAAPSRWRRTWRRCRSAATTGAQRAARGAAAHRGAAAGCGAAVAARLRAGRPQMLEVFAGPVRAVPVRASTRSVVTDDDLEIPLEAQGLSVFGANHVDGRRGSERLVAHELAHQWFGNSLTVGRLAATSGCTRGSPATPSGCGRRRRGGLAPTTHARAALRPAARPAAGPGAGAIRGRT